MILLKLAFKTETQKFSKRFLTGYSTTRNSWYRAGLWLVFVRNLDLILWNEMLWDSLTCEKQMCESGDIHCLWAEPVYSYFRCFEWLKNCAFSLIALGKSTKLIKWEQGSTCSALSEQILMGYYLLTFSHPEFSHRVSGYFSRFSHTIKSKPLGDRGKWDEQSFSLYCPQQKATFLGERPFLQIVNSREKSLQIQAAILRQ